MSDIYFKTNDQNWTDKIDNWESEFNSGDVVIGPGYGSFRTMFMVHQIDLNAPHDCVIHKGVFWDETEARVYADTLI